MIIRLNGRGKYSDNSKPKSPFHMLTGYALQGTDDINGTSPVGKQRGA